MRNLQFKYAKAENFFCFESIEINFASYGRIVLVTGKNLDAASDDKSSSNGCGKCFGLNTPILMYDGTIKMVQDVQIGDLVMGNDSTPRKVLSLGCGREMMYKVTPVKGTPYIVNKSHILSLKHKGSKNLTYHKGSVVNVSVQDYLSKKPIFRHMTGGYRAKIDFVEQEVLIDPYFLGVWLGDGSSHITEVTTMDKEIVDCIYTESIRRNLKVRKAQKINNKASTYTLSSSGGEKIGDDAFYVYKKFVEDKLNQIKISKTLSIDNSTVLRYVARVKTYLQNGGKIPNLFYNNFSEIPNDKKSDKKWHNCLLNDLNSYNLIKNKHIPHVYKCNSRAVRLQVLAGLMDTDGSMAHGGFDFVNKNQKLAEDVAFLARSLGLAAYVSPCQKTCVNNGVTGEYWRVSISGNCDEIPVRLKRKKCLPRNINKDPLVHGIKVEPIGIDDYYGFTVDGNHLFLLGDFTVVHNSSLPEIPVFALYGKTIKKHKKLDNTDVINNKNGKKMVVEFCWDEFRVVRTCDVKGKSTLKMWQSDKGEWNKDTELSLGGINATQAEIEKKIGLSYDTFINIYVFNADDPTNNFLECDIPKKREIVENLLSLDKYRGYHENAKNLLKVLNAKVKSLSKDYEYSLTEIDSAKDRVVKIEQQEVEWKKAREQEVTNFTVALQKKMKQLESSDAGAALVRYTEAQEQIKELQESIPALEEKRNKLRDNIDVTVPKLEQAKSKLQEILPRYNKYMAEKKNCLDIIDRNKETIKKCEDKIGGNCPYCLSVIDEINFKNVIEKSKEVIAFEENRFNESKPEWDSLFEECPAQEIHVTKMEKTIAQCRKQLDLWDKELTGIHTSIAELAKIKEPDVSTDERLAQEQIEQLKIQLANKKAEADGPSPFVKIHDSIVLEFTTKVQQSADKKQELNKVEKEIPYYEFWVKAFGDSGIRKYVIEGIIPTLNSRIAYWLQFLIDNKIKLVFDSQLKETIDRYPFLGRPYVYHGCSGGQRRRLNLSVAASFAYIQLLNVGCCPSAVWLDEVTMNMDEVGVDGIYRMICELAKERQVFVIDHNQSLLQMLDGCEKIQLVMQNEVTKKISV